MCVCKCGDVVVVEEGGLLELVERIVDYLFVAALPAMVFALFFPPFAVPFALSIILPGPRPRPGLWPPPFASSLLNPKP